MHPQCAPTSIMKSTLLASESQIRAELRPHCVELRRRRFGIGRKSNLSARQEVRAAKPVVCLDEAREKHHELLALGGRQWREKSILRALHVSEHPFEYRGFPASICWLFAHGGHSDRSHG